MPALPRAVRHLRALAYPELGLVGASVALVAAPQGEFRTALQEAMEDAPELPHSRLGGPWALDAAINRGSYLFNFDGITTANVDAWIELARRLGMSQIDFHGGQLVPLRRLPPQLRRSTPNGRADLKAAIDRLHAAGISAGLHTYAFFIAKDAPWVTPVPDPRLATDPDVHAGNRPRRRDDDSQRSWNRLRASRRPPASSCATARRSGSARNWSSSAACPARSPSPSRSASAAPTERSPAHTPEARKVGHLKECFGLFAPDPDSTLFAEVAAATADTYNDCGFDMIYLDALDGSDVLDSHRHGEFAWHYAPRFAFEIAKRLRRPAVFEMSTFMHHLWCIRSRYVAWDHPNRSYKRFVDLHCAANEESRRMFLPGELGWWALKGWNGAQTEPTYADDIEYLLAKGLATDTGFALMGIDPKTAAASPALPRLAELIRRWETLRLSGQVPAAIKDRLRVPGAEFTLEGDLNVRMEATSGRICPSSDRGS